MKLYTIDAGLFKLDGGAMFGVVPKKLWAKQLPPDADNLCTWAMRCLLIEDGPRLILIDNGMGDKQDAKFFGHYAPHGPTLEESLKRHGFTPDDITDVFLTHLHFDHCGGSVKWNGRRDGFEPAFRNARYWSNEYHWEWATKPNAREKASFLKENIMPIQESGQLEMVDIGRRSREENLYVRAVFPHIDVFLVNGHTDAMMIPHIHYKGRTIAYMADLLPSVHHVPIPWVMGYDTRPLLTMDEKSDFLRVAAREDFVLYFEHDATNVCCTVHETEKGVRVKDILRLEEL
ncbi:MAG: MBL fold metallo-hydrolase [Flavobacteriales bacterium]|jgi:glyoxylase-like metal-dependent hydrolase (beta-lactamase superfamily II)|nr:MBL fold metallo-hydrolase [Flavobacteriales bacterium]